MSGDGDGPGGELAGAQARDRRAAEQAASDRAYRIGLIAARSAAMTGQAAEQFADKMRSWLTLSPAADSEPVDGTVLDPAAAQRAALWIHFAHPEACIVFLIMVGTFALAIVERAWSDVVTLIVCVGLLIAVQFRSLRRWQARAPGLLPWLPPAGTRVTVGPTALAVGEATIPYEQIRIDHIRLRSRWASTMRWAWPGDREYFLDHVTLVAGGKIIHLDATAIRNGQVILDTLCSRIPLTAFA